MSVNDRRTVTDRDGRFTLRVPASLALVELTLNGFYPLATTIDVRETDVTTAELLLVQRSTYSSSVDVVAEQPTVAAPTAVAVASAEVLRTPGALDNVFRTLQTLPGVSATEEFGSRIAVRGGAPDQNLTIMDGVEIHDPYRLFGLTSAFNPETISRFELATGGFSPKYGDRLSSLLLVENREGTRSKALDGSYYMTYFGCWVDAAGVHHADPNDNCLPGCFSQAQAAGLCKSNETGKQCEEKTVWFTANNGRFGCLSRLRIENPKNGKAVVAVVLDGGPACSAEQKIKKAMLDTSAPVFNHLFDDGKTWTTTSYVHVVEVDGSTPLGVVR